MTSAWIGSFVLASLLGARARAANDDDEAGVRGRAELAARIARCLEHTPELSAAELSEEERAFGLVLSALESEGMRVLATSGEDEPKRAARYLGAARELFTELSGAPASYPSGLCVVLLGTSEAKDTYLRKHKKLGPELSARLARLECAGVPGTADWAFWESDAEERLDGVLRLAFNWLLRTPGITVERHAWLHEGLGFYLTHALSGTYLTWIDPLQPSLAQRTADNVALHAQMKEPGADWLVLARGLFAEKHKFDLEELLHLETRELDPSDYLRIHALAAYLVEVRHESLAAVLTRVGAGEDPRRVLEEALGFPLTELRKRIDGWLERREELVARAEGRRTEAELTAQWRGLNGVQKRAAVAELERQVAALDTAQMRTLRALRAAAPAEIGRPGELAFFDPKVHAPAQPIARKRLSIADSRVKRLLKEVRKAPDPRAPIVAYDYDWGSARVVRTGDPNEPDSVFHNALLGLPPGADLARAQALSMLDDEDERKLQAAFAHAYTDREGNVYPVTLYEMWATGDTIEMPDVDTLGILHDVRGEWRRWVAPVPGSEHDALYKVLGELFASCRRSRELRLSMAELLLAPGMTPRKGYESLAFNLHALWASHDSDPAKLASVLPEGKESEAYLVALVERCKQDYKLYAQGRRRAALLRQDALGLRKALGLALGAGAAAVPAEAPAAR